MPEVVTADEQARRHYLVNSLMEEAIRSSQLEDRHLKFYELRDNLGYRLVEYLSISAILRDAPADYCRAFVFTESDERDTTYFLIHQLRVIERAIGELDAYLRRKVGEIRDAERFIRGSAGFNHRQLALLSNALRTPEQTYTFQSHAASHGVTHETARNDLLALVTKGLLSRRRAGRKHVVTPAARLADVLKADRGAAEGSQTGR